MTRMPSLALHKRTAALPEAGPLFQLSMLMDQNRVEKVTKNWRGAIG